MAISTSRRLFLQTTAASAALGLADWGLPGRLPPVSAAEARPDPKRIPLPEDVRPLVRLLEETPRDKLLEEVAARIHAGTSYREVLAALLLAGVLNVQPRPNVGFKFHAVLVVNSAHLASLSSPDEHRWLPIFWALDYFKEAQAKDVSEGDWAMSPVDEAAVPPPEKARDQFINAMENWDEAQADAAIVGLARTSGSNRVYEALFRFGCRDFRDIGHKAIYVANSLRTLACIGWQNAEPVVRSVTYALLQHEGENPAKRDAAPDHSGRRNIELAHEIPDTWQHGRVDDGATRELLTSLRSAEPDAVCDQVVELLKKGIAPQSIWDALHVGAGELLMRQAGIVPIHAVTSTNALHYAYQVSSSDATRRLLLLQNAAFLPLFRQAMAGRGKLDEVQLDKLEPESTKAKGSDALKEIFADIGDNRTLAARKVLAYVKQHPEPKQLIDMARVLVFLKGRDAHDYKFSSALLEDYAQLSPGWRERYLASGVFNLRSSAAKDNQLVERTRAALKA